MSDLNRQLKEIATPILTVNPLHKFGSVTPGDCEAGFCKCWNESVNTHTALVSLSSLEVSSGIHTQANIDRLQRVQNILARVVAQVPSTISSVHIRRDLHWLPVNHSISYKLSLLTWKALHTAEPSYFSELISPYAPARTLRSLPVYIHSSEKLSTFKRHLKSHFFQSPFTV